MSNKAIHQLPLTTSDDGSDLLIIDRETSPGVWANFSIPKSQVGLYNYVTSGILSSAQVLDLHDTPIVVVVAPVSTKIIVPRLFVLKAIAGSTDYDTNTAIVIGPTGLVDDTHSCLTSFIPTVGASTTASTNSASRIGAVSAGVSMSFYVETGNPLSGDYSVSYSVVYNLIDA
jgi:hypothetical protein